MRPFDHYTPNFLGEALNLLAGSDGATQLIAGGSDLLPKMRSGGIAPSVVINIKRLAELKGIQFDRQSGLRLGPLTTLRELTRSPLIQEHYSVLALAASLMASEQVRSVATVGGNLCTAAPSADLAPPLLAIDAEVTLASLAGTRRLPLHAFFLAPGKTALEPGELLTAIAAPPPAGTTHYLKHASRAYMDIAVVGVGIHIEMEKGAERVREARIALGAVAPIPLRARQAEDALRGEPLTGRRVEEAAELAAAASAPIDDVRSPAWYRREMVKVLTRRGLQLMQGQLG